MSVTLYACQRLSIDREIHVTTDTRETIMSTARLAVQARGYNALSFREIAKEVGVKSASIHYHFPTKGDLGAALAQRYTADLTAYLDGLLTEFEDRKSRLARYTDLFRQALLKENRMCMCGIMAAEYGDLPAEVRVEVDRFTEANVRWLVEVLSPRKGATDAAAVKQRALAIFAAIEGAQLIARGRGDVAVYDAIVTTYRTTGLIP
jgi:TetR/AcrR family transcriptional repressor of nem operon